MRITPVSRAVYSIETAACQNKSGPWVIGKPQGEFSARRGERAAPQGTGLPSASPLAYGASLSSSSLSSSSNREIEDEDEDEDEKAPQQTGLNGFMPTLFPAILTIHRIVH
jgi:hypothetical protein